MDFLLRHNVSPLFLRGLQDNFSSLLAAAADFNDLLSVTAEKQFVAEENYEYSQY